MLGTGDLSDSIVNKGLRISGAPLFQRWTLGSPLNEVIKVRRFR